MQAAKLPCFLARRPNFDLAFKLSIGVTLCDLGGALHCTSRLFEHRQDFLFVVVTGTLRTPVTERKSTLDFARVLCSRPVLVQTAV